jgi:hypothetical protein
MCRDFGLKPNLRRIPHHIPAAIAARTTTLRFWHPSVSLRSLRLIRCLAKVGDAQPIDFRRVGVWPQRTQRIRSDVHRGATSACAWGREGMCRDFGLRPNLRRILPSHPRGYSRTHNQAAHLGCERLFAFFAANPMLGKSRRCSADRFSTRRSLAAKNAKDTLGCPSRCDLCVRLRARGDVP